MFLAFHKDLECLTYFPLSWFNSARNSAACSFLPGGMGEKIRRVKVRKLLG